MKTEEESGFVTLAATQSNGVSASVNGDCSDHSNGTAGTGKVQERTSVEAVHESHFGCPAVLLGCVSHARP